MSEKLHLRLHRIDPKVRLRLTTAALVVATALAAVPRPTLAASMSGTNGTGWTLQTSPTTATLYGVACPAPDVCYAVGDSGTILATTGGQWTTQQSGGTLLKGISCPSKKTCYAVGYSGTILATKDGRTWSAETSGVTVSLQGVSCVSQTTCFAVSSFLNPLGENGGILKTSNGGTSWGQVYSDGTGFLYSISCPTAGANYVCYAAGSQGLVLYSADGGNTWTQQLTGGTSDWFLGITCPSTTVCYAATKNGYVYKLGRAGWSPQASDHGGGSSGPFLHSVSCSGRWMCHAVGDSGMTLVTATGGVPLKSGDVPWSACASPSSSCAQCASPVTYSCPQIPGTTNGLNGVSCPSIVRCYAVGQSGVILTTNPWGVDTDQDVSMQGDIAATQTSGLGTPQFVARYLYPHYTPLTHTEATFVLDQGIPILLIDFPNGTFTGGTTDAKTAIDQAKSLGVPAGTAIFRDIEGNIPTTCSKPPAPCYIKDYYDEFKSASQYVPGFYENPLAGSSNFGQQFCTAVGFEAAIATGTALWSFEPELASFDPHQALMPVWQPDQIPPCGGTATPASAWQYKQMLDPRVYPNVDVNEFLPSAANVLWVGP